MSPEREAIVEQFLADWIELLICLHDDYGCTLTCDEADALTALLREFGREVTADRIALMHAGTDECGDGHHTPCQLCASE